MKTTQVTMAVALAAAMVVQVQAKTVYVGQEPTDSDDNDGTTAEKAYRTFAKACSEAGTKSDTIYVKRGVYLLDAEITTGNLIGLSSPEDTILDGQGKVRCVHTLASKAQVRNVTVANGYHDSAKGNGTGGGGICFEGSWETVTLSNCVVTGCKSTGHGGGVMNSRSLLAVDCRFENCESSKRGGAVLCGVGASDRFVRCSFVNNRAPGTANGCGGGAVCGGNETNSKTGSPVFEDCGFTNNWSALKGGAILDNCAGLIRCSFKGNVAKETGGAWYGYKSNNAGDPAVDVPIVGSVFVDNVNTNTGGGAIYLSQNFQLHLTNCTFVSNRSVNGSGGAVCIASVVSGSAILCMVDDLVHCTFTDNMAGSSGGALVGFVGYAESCVFSGNQAVCNGGAWQSSSASAGCRYPTTVVTNCTFADNHVTGRTRPSNSAVAGGAAMLGHNMTETTLGARTYDFRNCRFVGNSICGSRENYWRVEGNGWYRTNSWAPQFGGGGAVWSMESVNFSDCLFEGNFAGGRGGALYGICTNGIALLRCAFVNNAAITVTNKLEYSAHGGAVSVGEMPSNGVYRIVDCGFTNNFLHGCRGAAVHSRWGQLEVTGCSFVSNVFERGEVNADWQGIGGVVVADALTSTTTRYPSFDVAQRIDRCRFEDNQTEAYGCVMFNGYGLNQNGALSYVRNSLFIGNRNVSTNKFGYNCGYGAGLIVHNKAVPVENCTFVGNHAVQGGGAISVSVANSPIVNCVFYGNTTDADDQTQRNIRCSNAAYVSNFSHCFDETDSALTATEENGNIVSSACPFVEMASGDYTVRKNLGREAGVFQSWMTSALDLAGKARCNGELVDIGCYQFCPRPGLMLLLK